MKLLSINQVSPALQGFALLLTMVFASSAWAAEYRVESQEEYRSVLAKLEPGDSIILKDGVWRDFEIIFEGNGKPGNPLTLRAETPGAVFITGQSNLALAGQHLLVSGLIFRDGYTPSQSVISFRKDKTTLANNSRVTQTVIHNFTNPERFEADYWVAIYGKNNRFDHNHLEGKRNRGVTLAVRLDSEASRENYHRIDHNYFGPRPTLGSNGGETLRIGTSHFSRSNSFTTVENNYFDRCDGEVEIISSKSGSNVLKGNVFFESKGTLTLRHGHDNLVEENVFLGNGIAHTGGIRVINRRQTIKNNYIEGVKGYRFGGALVVMNGVPNSPINRYDGVEDSVIESNSLINSDHIQLAAGSDAERSAVPVRTTFDKNLIVQVDRAPDVFTVYDDISGISFNENVISGSRAPVTSGFESRSEVTLSRAIMDSSIRILMFWRVLVLSAVLRSSTRPPQVSIGIRSLRRLRDLIPGVSSKLFLERTPLLKVSGRPVSVAPSNLPRVSMKSARPLHLITRSPCAPRARQKSRLNDPRCLRLETVGR
jgi:poly(beta-D-mannuronate) lyase